MAMRCGLFDSTAVVNRVGGFPVGNKAQSADFFARYFESFLTSGVYDGDPDSFKLVPGGGRILKMRPGRAFLKGYFCMDEEETAWEVPYSGESQSLILRLRLNEAAGEIRCELLSAEEVELQPVREGGIFDLWLAMVYLPGGCEEITEDMIYDERWEEACCGAVRSLRYGGAERLDKPFRLTLKGGAVGSAEIDGGEDVEIEVRSVNPDYATEGVLSLECGGTGASDAETARINLDAAAREHVTSPADIEAGNLGKGVVAINELDSLLRLRNISICETLPADQMPGSLCAVWGEADRGLYLYLGDGPIRLTGV